MAAVCSIVCIFFFMRPERINDAINPTSMITAKTPNPMPNIPKLSTSSYPSSREVTFAAIAAIAAASVHVCMVVRQT